MGRAPCCDKANVKKGPWSPEEDATLKSYIEKHGTGGNWIALPQKIGIKRCGKSCRLRWLNYLRPNIKHGGFTEDEDNLICSLYISIGSRWSIIAAQMPGRTDNDIKNYWNTKLKKKLLGKQRREQAAKRGSKFKTSSLLEDQSSTNRCDDYAINDSFRLYPWPQPSAAPQPLQVSHATDPNSLITDALIMPQTQFINNGDNLETFSHYTSTSENQQVCMNSSTCPSFINSDFDDINGLSANNFQALQEIQENMIYSMPQELNLDGSFSVVDTVSSSQISTVSPESSTSFGADIISLVYSSSGLPSYEACNQNLSTLFDEPRLLGFS